MTIPAWPGTFTDGVSTIPATFISWLKTNLVKAGDFVNGGNYSPSSQIVVSGAGISSDNIGTSTVTGDLTVNGAVDCDTTLNVDGATTLVGATTAAAITASGLVTLTGKTLLSGTGAGIRYRVDASEVADADATIDVDFDVYISAAVPTSQRTITLRHSTSPVPVAGERIRVVNTRTSGAANWIFQREDATELAKLTTTVNAGRGSLEFVYDGTKWWASGGGGDGVISNHS
jgi:hypothetical protein